MSKALPWRRAVLEGLVIVASILLAFGIQAWWDELQEDEQRREVLSALAASATAGRDSVLSLIDSIEETQEAAATFFRTPPEELRAVPRTELTPIMQSLARAFAGDLSSGSLLGVTKSAEVTLVDDESLRALLYAWDLAETSLNQVAANSATAELEVIRALSRHGAIQRRYLLRVGADSLFDLSAARSDPLVVEAVTAVSFQRGLYESILRRQIGLLEAIEAAALEASFP